MALHAAEAFGLDPLLVTVREGDSNALAVGSGTGGSKSLLTSSVALAQAVTDVLSRARPVLGERMGRQGGCAEVCGRGLFDSYLQSSRLDPRHRDEVSGRARRRITQRAAAREQRQWLPRLQLEIDRETGDVRIIRYVAVDDFGVVVNEGAVRGQVPGGVAQGIGQVLMECAPSPEALTWPVATSPFALVLPRATDIPVVEWSDNGLPSRTNIFGAKACGKLGCERRAPYGDERHLQRPGRPSGRVRPSDAGAAFRYLANSLPCWVGTIRSAPIPYVIGK